MDTGKLAWSEGGGSRGQIEVEESRVKPFSIDLQNNICKTGAEMHLR